MKICIFDYKGNNLEQEFDDVLYVENDYTDPKDLEIAFKNNVGKIERLILKHTDYSRITIY